jgi:hypothetical protein
MFRCDQPDTPAHPVPDADSEDQQFGCDRDAEEGREKVRNEKAVEFLKINNPAKSVIHRS